MDRKERIRSYISSNTYVPLKLKELAIVLDVPDAERGALAEILESLEKEGRIYRTKKGRYCAVNESAAVVACVLMCSAAGCGFARPDGGGKDIFIPREKLGGAYDRDRVLVRIDGSGGAKGSREGHIERILERGNKSLVGVLVGVKGGYYRVSPDRREFFSQVRVRGEDICGARTGDRVIVSIEEYSAKGKPIGKITAVLGRADSAESCLNGLIAENNIPERFSRAALEEAGAVGMSVTEDDIRGREDLRDRIIFTIDGDDSRDFDDAVSLERTPDGGLLLGVHIADVSHYVKENSALDREALSRGTSVYFPSRVIPMLPKRLSNGICSLNPDEDRLTLSVFLEMSDDGSIRSCRIAETVIHSRARMTYGDVNKILDGDTKLRDRYSFIVPVLEEMDRLSDALAKKRSERGAIDFDFPEASIECDRRGEPISVKMRERGRGERLIESFMLAANEAVAETAYWAELPFVYRVHDAPDSERIRAFNEFIKNFGYFIKGSEENIHPKDLQRVLERAKGRPEEPVIADVMLRSLMKAGYREKNDGHFGLAAKFYCHFTSPIRRYPDLIVHRILKELISGGLDDDRQRHYEPKVSEAARISSEREIAAQTAERDADDMFKAVYMRRFIGEEFDAVITSVTSFGMFASLENTCEGLIRRDSMMSDRFEYDESRRILAGRRSGGTYKTGDRVRIVAAASDPLTRRVDFVLAEDVKAGALDEVGRKTERKRGKGSGRGGKRGRR